MLRLAADLPAVEVRVVALRALVLAGRVAALFVAPALRVAAPFFPEALRGAGPFFADRLRSVGPRLLVDAAFSVALLGVSAPWTSRRFSIVSAALRRSLTTRRAAFSAPARASGPRLSRSDSACATRLRRPCERNDEKKSLLLFLAMSREANANDRGAAARLPRFPKEGPRSLGRRTQVHGLIQTDMEVVHLSRIRLFCLLALAAAALAAPAVAQAAATPERFEGVTVKRYVMGRVKPSTQARGAAHLWTNTGFSNRRAVYPVVRHQVLENGSEWVQVEALRARTQVRVWIPKWATHRVWIAYRVKIDLSSRLATVYRDGKVARRFRVVVGARSTPTPTGQWYVVDRLRLRTSWAYGKWALATSAFSRILKHFEGGQGQVAMHARGSLVAPVGTAASHGCVRFRDGDIAWMAAHVPNGTQVSIKQ